ncbi:FMN-binding protein [Streptomyces marokkonensis]|uniref:FMN-binding protein n=1 Tax=Streptomyces marokkonensis TaxID=324855 RepID=A0ABW6PZJ7_9ACTN
MKRALPVLVLSVAGLIPVWRHTPPAPAAAEPATPAPSVPASPGGTTRVVAGPAVDTEKGTVQVEVTLDGDRITAVRMLRQPDHPQTTAAVPVLVEETLEAQSADIDAVSGATVTSDGYKESLQAALDAQGS